MQFISTVAPVVKTQPIVYPANPSAVGTSVIGSPLQTDGSPTGIRAIVTSIAPFHPLTGISENPIPSGLDPIVGSLSQTNPVAPASPIAPLIGVPAPVLSGAPATDYSAYAIYAALAFLAYFLFRGE
jgi:hypothetical protein